MRATLEADHSDAESGAESETGVSSFKRSNPGQLAKLQLLAAPAHEGAPADAGDADAGALPWSMIVVNGKGLPCEEVTAVRVDERGLEFVVEHAKRSASARTERVLRRAAVVVGTAALLFAVRRCKGK